jgi:hypothetical protein
LRRAAPPPVRPILITGSHRSGTTWTAHGLARSPEVAFIDEPFNPDYRPRRVTRPFPHWFQYVTPDNEAAFVPELDRAFRLRYPLRQVVELRSPAELERFGREAVAAPLGRLRRSRILCKDPIAVFSAPWLADHYRADVVVCIRHPAGFASSLLRLNWDFDFSNWLRQPLFMRDCAGEYAAEIEEFARRPPPRVEQAILLWRVIYARVHHYQVTHPGWTFVRHEDQAADPVSTFRDIYRDCGLDFSPDVRRFLVQSSGEGNPEELPPEAFKSVRRHSAAAARTWVTRLSPEVIRQVREGTARETAWFYDDADWLGT